MTITALLAARFSLVRNPLSKAFMWSLCAKFIASAGITYLSYRQLAGEFSGLSDEAATAIRVGMFLAMLASSIHMALLIRNLEKGQ